MGKAKCFRWSKRKERQFQVEKNRSCISCLEFLLGKCCGLIQLHYTGNCVFTLAERTESYTSKVKPAHFHHSNVTFSHALKYGRTAEHGAERHWKMWRMFLTCQHLPREPKLQADTLVKSNRKKTAFWQSFRTFTFHTKTAEAPFAPRDPNALPGGSRLTHNKSSHVFPKGSAATALAMKRGFWSSPTYNPSSYLSLKFKTTKHLLDST